MRAVRPIFLFSDIALTLCILKLLKLNRLGADEQHFTTENLPNLIKNCDFIDKIGLLLNNNKINLAREIGKCP